MYPPPPTPFLFLLCQRLFYVERNDNDQLFTFTSCIYVERKFGPFLIFGYNPRWKDSLYRIG